MKIIFNQLKSPLCLLISFWRHLKKPNVHLPLLCLILFAVTYPFCSFGIRVSSVIAIITVLFYFHSSRWLWFLFFLIGSIFYGEFYYKSHGYWPSNFKHLWLICYVGALYLSFLILRVYLISLPIVKILRAIGFVPNISQTEREALEAGAVWMEKEYFKGYPDFKKLFSQPYPKLTNKEQTFIDKQTDNLCKISDEWKIIKTKKFPEEVERFLKQNKFLGMIIPEEHGGLGFSPLAHARVIEKISSANFPVAIITMVPNSLGPAELLLQYGTTKQQNKYLSRLAKGEEIPCFGLTEPQAGSDASSIRSGGVLFKGDDGRLKIKLSWEKRWITLSVKASLLGVAFQLKDPQNLYSNKENLGITCALIPANTPGVERGLYHDPMGIPFYNAPMKGKDVIIDAEDSIIGGLKQSGKGWKMLMECLVAGRGISLPSLSIGAGKRIAWIVKHHSSIRKQFGVPLAKFEGVQEPLTRIAGLTNLMAATQDYTLSALNQGIHPPIVTAITKHYTTEMVRKISLDGMDIMAGAGLSLGPKNMIANLYKSLPIAVTVEGANILTRTLIIYGQGSLRAHPYAYQEIKSLENNDFELFDKVFWSHLYQVICNTVRMYIMSLFRGYSYLSLSHLGREHRYIQKIAWSSSVFSWLTDHAIFLLGAKIKSKEKITGRFADMLSYQYMATALIWKWVNEGRDPKQWPLVHWGLDFCFYQIQLSVESLLLNLKWPFILWPVHKLLYLILRINPIGLAPNDKISDKLVNAFLEDEDLFSELTNNLYVHTDADHHMQKIKNTYKLVKQSEDTVKKIKQAIKQKKIPKKRVPFAMEEALKSKIITQQEFDNLKITQQARYEAIQVDAFTEEQYLNNTVV